MRNILLAAANGRRQWWADKVKMQLKFSSASAMDVITGVAVSRNNSSAVTFDTANKMIGEESSLKFNGTSNTFASLPNDASYLPGTGDFTVETVFSFSNILFQPADGSYVVPLFYWGTWAAGSNPVNLEMFYYKNSDLIIISGISHGIAVAATIPPLSLNSRIHIAMVRKDGMLSIYVNGTRVAAPSAFAHNLTNVTNSLFRLGQRRGGSAGTVYWQMVGNIYGMRIVHEAIYNGPTCKVPTEF